MCRASTPRSIAGVVVLDPRQHPLLAAVRRRCEDSEEVADEAVGPIAARARGPDHPNLIGTAADCLLKAEDAVWDNVPMTPAEGHAAICEM